MAADDALHNGESGTAALILILVVEALEDAEQLVIVAHIETRAVIPNKIDDFGIPGFTADLDQRNFSLPGEFDGFGYEVYEDLPDECAVSGGCGGGGYPF